MPNFMQIRLVGAQFFHADGQTDMTKLIDAFCNFTKATDNCGLCLVFKNIFLRSNVMRRNMLHCNIIKC